jgi:hypothetical protein
MLATTLADPICKHVEISRSAELGAMSSALINLQLLYYRLVQYFDQVRQLGASLLLIIFYTLGDII